MKAWEYKSLIVRLSLLDLEEQRDEAVQHAIDRAIEPAGTAGWDLASATPIEFTEGFENHSNYIPAGSIPIPQAALVLIFKRPKADMEVTE